MKKILLLLPCIVLPYIMVFLTYCIYSGFLMDTLFDNFIINVVIYLLIFILIAFICNVIFISLAYKKKWNPKEILKLNMIVKLVQIPAYITIFILGIICMFTIFTIGFSLCYFLFDVFSILLTGMIGGMGIIMMKVHNNKLSLFQIINIFLQFIFCVDIVSAILIYINVKNSNIELIDTVEVESVKRDWLTLLTVGINIVLVIILVVLSETVYFEIEDFSLLPIWFKFYIVFTFLGIIPVFIIALKRNKDVKLPIFEGMINIALGFVLFILSICFVIVDAPIISFIISFTLFFLTIIYGAVILAKVINYFRFRKKNI